MLKPEMKKQKPVMKYWLYIVAVLITIIVLPIITNIIVSTPAPFKFMVIKWNTQEATGYLGSMLAAIGTIFLGVVSLIQTKQIKNQETESHNANTMRPVFTIQEIKGLSSKWGMATCGYVTHVYNSDTHMVKIKNVGDGIANNLTIYPWGFGYQPKDKLISFVLEKGQWCNIPIPITPKNQSDYTETKHIYYENLIGYAYKQEITIKVSFDPEITHAEYAGDGHLVEEYKDRYEVKIYSLGSQVPLGMKKYNFETGIYDVEDLMK